MGGEGDDRRPCMAADSGEALHTLPASLPLHRDTEPSPDQVPDVPWCPEMAEGLPAYSPLL